MMKVPIGVVWNTTWFVVISGSYLEWIAIDRKVILGKKAHDEAVEKIESWKRGENKYSDAELWKARNIIESMEHPQTKEIINPIGRMSCFVPANIPIQIGMLLAPPTVFVSIELCEM